VQPLVTWLWTGGAVMGFGTFLAAWPGRRRRRPAEPDAQPAADSRPAADPEPVVVS
jgi:cytochrome c-type biogenesis protein CcmF